MVENAKIKKQCHSKRGRGDIQLIAPSASVTLNFYPIFKHVSVRIFLQNCLKTANYRVNPKHANYILKVMKTNNMGNLNFVDFKDLKAVLQLRRGGGEGGKGGKGGGVGGRHSTDSSLCERN